jgi:hypothetical protein
MTTRILTSIYDEKLQTALTELATAKHLAHIGHTEKCLKVLITGLAFLIEAIEIQRIQIAQLQDYTD